MQKLVNSEIQLFLLLISTSGNSQILYKVTYNLTSDNSHIINSNHKISFRWTIENWNLQSTMLSGLTYDSKWLTQCLPGNIMNKTLNSSPIFASAESVDIQPRTNDTKINWPSCSWWPTHQIHPQKYLGTAGMIYPPDQSHHFSGLHIWLTDD